MSLLLNIDTATDTAHVSIAKDGIVLKDLFNQEQKTHAGFLQPAIKKILKDTGIAIAEIDAVAVTEGPGSYTGLRIGMSSAKGLCYAFNKPLITISTLKAMANAAVIKLKTQPGNKVELLCPMVEARRMEVFTTLYDFSLNIILPPCAMILEKNSFHDFFNNFAILFLGNGSDKWENVCQDKNAFFQKITTTSQSLSELSIKEFSNKNFANTAYSTPVYLKEYRLIG
jgi:tRNA threonylcarbamoyladenosine biosynthesis protein TsaB